MFSCTLQGLSAGRPREQQKRSDDIGNLPRVLIKLVLMKSSLSHGRVSVARRVLMQTQVACETALSKGAFPTPREKILDQCPNKTKSVPTTRSGAATKSLYSTFWTAASASSQEFRSGVEAR